MAGVVVYLFRWIVLLLVLTNPSLENQMDPHIYPHSGPFFEGWYMRIVDASNGCSFGWLFGKVLPAMNHENCNDKNLTCERGTINSSSPLVYSSLLIDDGKQKLQSYTGFFKTKDYKVTKNGKPVDKNPDDHSPPAFEVRIGSNISFIVRPEGTTFSLSVGNSILQGSTSSPEPWGPGGEGPEGWLEHLPLPVHWFVYSLRSRVVQYSYRNKDTGQMFTGPDRYGSPVLAHMEKDWGKSFPKAWIWAEGLNSVTNVSFAISSGVISELDIDIKAQLSGYRNPNKSIHCSFSPVNSIHELKYDGCSGSVNFTVESPECKVNAIIFAQNSSFSDCLYTPKTDGFIKGCQESYSANAFITVYQRDNLQLIVTDKQNIKMAALEFGGDYMCNGQCPIN